MNKLLIILVVAMGFISCQSRVENKLPEGVHAVQVNEAINASNYTYLNVTENGKILWIAVPQMQVEKGESLYFSKSMEMKNFHSETLDRDFESILFVQDVSRTLAEPQSMAETSQVPNHPQIKVEQEQNIAVDKAKDGVTIAQVYSDKESLKGKNVLVRGQVVKYNEMIMNRNWIHIQDGTGQQGSHDLLVTTQQSASVGDVVMVEGTVAVDQDFGSGYSYSVMLENAKITVEKSAGQKSL